MKTPRILATAIALLTAVPFHVSAQYWDAEDYLNNSNVGNPLNWQGDIAPVNDGTASLFFNSVGIANSSTPNFAVAWSVNRLQVDTNYTLTGQAVTIGAGGLNLFGLGSVFFDNRINFTADQSFDLAAQTAHFRGGLDINATTLTLDSVNGGDFHTTGLYGTGTINQTGGTWHHKSGGYVSRSFS